MAGPWVDSVQNSRNTLSSVSERPKKLFIRFPQEEHSHAFGPGDPRY